MPASDNPRAQPIVAFDICFRLPAQVQRLRRFQRLKRAFPVNDAVQDVQHMGLCRNSLRQCLLDGSQNCLLIMMHNQGEDIDHLPVTARLAQKMFLQLAEE